MVFGKFIVYCFPLLIFWNLQSMIFAYILWKYRSVGMCSSTGYLYSGVFIHFGAYKVYGFVLEIHFHRIANRKQKKKREEEQQLKTTWKMGNSQRCGASNNNTVESRKNDQISKQNEVKQVWMDSECGVNLFHVNEKHTMSAIKKSNAG